MAVVPLSTFLGRPSGAAAPALASARPQTGIIPLRTFLGGDGAAASPLTRTPMVRATPPTIPSVNPALADLSAARAGLGLAGSAGNITNLVSPGTVPSSALAGIQGVGGALQLALALARRGDSIPRALSGISGATGVAQAALRLFPETAKSLLPATGAFSPAPLGTGLGVAGAAAGLGLGAFQLAQARSDLQKGVGAANVAGALTGLAMLTNPVTAPFAWIPSLVAGGGGTLAGLFGKPDIPHEVREAREASRDIGAASPMAGQLQAAATADELWAKGLPWMSGYVGGSHTPAVAVNAYLPRDLVEFGGGNTFENWSANNAVDPSGRVPVPYLFGNANPYYPTVRPEKRADALAYIGQNPEVLSSVLQSGISPELKAGFNSSITEVIRSLAGSAGKPAGAVAQQTPPPLPLVDPAGQYEAYAGGSYPSLTHAQAETQIRNGGLVFDRKSQTWFNHPSAAEGGYRSFQYDPASGALVSG